MTPFEQTREQLRQIGISILHGPGEYVLVYKTGTTQQNVRTVESLQEALFVAKEMADKAPPPPELPIGPLPRKSISSSIRSWNMQLLIRRWKRKHKKVQDEIMSRVKR